MNKNLTKSSHFNTSYISLTSSIWISHCLCIKIEVSNKYNRSILYYKLLCKYCETNQVIVFFKVARQQTPCWRERGVMPCWVNERQPSLISVPFLGSTRNTFRPSVEEASPISCWTNKRYSWATLLSKCAVAQSLYIKQFIPVLQNINAFFHAVGMHSWYPGSTSDKHWYSHQRHPVTQGQGTETGLWLVASVLQDQSVRHPGH